MKILVIHASAGAGHTKAAEAIYNGIKDTTSFSVVCVDALDFTSRFYKKIYQGTYALLISKLPWLWGLFFWVTDIPKLRGLVRFLRRTFNSFNARFLVKFLQKENFDYILSTHFFPNEVAAFLKRNSLISSKIISVVTDFDIHSIWLAEGIDTYAVACDYTAQKLVSFGIIAQEKIVVTGIPTHEKFSKRSNREELKTRLDLNKDIFTVLIATGSFGIGPIEKIVVALKDYQTLVICGRNQMLFAKLIQRNLKHARIYGLVHNMDELMTVADCMVTKPGGLSISEALVCSLPLIFFNAIPGQEKHNVKVLKHYGIGLHSRSIRDITREIKKLSSLKEYFVSIRNNTQALARPSAVKDIINLLV
jgi:processive 1,2-diacylglycerol beta-glucosyltransferase